MAHDNWQWVSEKVRGTFNILQCFLGTIAPAREIPGDETDVDSNDQFMKALQYFFTNINLVLPVVASVIVIVSAIVFICVFRARHAQMMKPGNWILSISLFVEKIGGAFGAGEEGQDNGRSKNPFADLPEWLDLNIIVPTIATVIVICVGIIIVCAVCVITKRRPQMTPGWLSKNKPLSLSQFTWFRSKFVLQRIALIGYLFFLFLQRSMDNTMDKWTPWILTEWWLWNMKGCLMKRWLIVHLLIGNFLLCLVNIPTTTPLIESSMVSTALSHSFKVQCLLNEWDFWIQDKERMMCWVLWIDFLNC